MENFALITVTLAPRDRRQDRGERQGVEAAAPACIVSPDNRGDPQSGCPIKR